MSSLIKIENVTFQYPGGERPVISEVSLAIEKGEFVAILGGNGSGKSTLCKLLNGLIPHYYVGTFEGEVLVNGLLTTEHKVAALSEHVGYVYQDFENQIVCPRVLEDVCFAPLHYGYKDYEERAKKALELVGLKAFENEFIWSLSGGQKHLLALASVLALNPEIIIIDEPVAQLDPQHAEEIYEILKMLNEKHQKTIIVIEHHTEFVAAYTKQVILINQGRIVWKKCVSEALRDVGTLLENGIFPPQVTQAAYLASPNGSENNYLPLSLEEGKRFFVPYRESYTVEKLPEERTKKKTIVEMKEVSFSYKTLQKKRKQVLTEIDLTIYEGDYIALLGNNGAGKSSLMRLMTGLVKPNQGHVTVKGRNTKHYPPEIFSEIATYIYQNPEQMFIDDCVKKDVSFYMKSRKVPNYEKRVADILEQFELTDLAEQDSRLMSGGQQRRASLAIGVAMNPEIMLLDEPTANLDIGTRKHITKLLTQLKGQLEAVVIATHDMQLACEFANRIIVMNEGNIIHDGDRDSVFRHESLLIRAGLKQPQILALTKELELNQLAFTVDEFVAGWKNRRIDYTLQV